MSGFAFGFGDYDEEEDVQRPATRGGGGGAGRPASSRGALGSPFAHGGGFANYPAGLGPRHPPDTASTYDYDAEVSYVTGHAQSFTSSTSGTGTVPGTGRPITRGMTGRRMSDLNEEDEYGYGDGWSGEEDEDEESDAEGVFAYLPPGTAELQAATAAQQQQQQQQQQGGTVVLQPAPGLAGSPMVTPPAPAYYSPTNFAYTNPFSHSTPANSNSNISLPAAPGIPRPPVSLLPVESPPATNSSISASHNPSRQQETLEEYRLRPLTSPLAASANANNAGGATSIGSMPVSVSLPGTATAAASSSLNSPPPLGGGGGNNAKNKRKTNSRGSSKRQQRTPDSREIRTASSGYTTTSFPYSFSKKYGRGKMPKTPTTTGSGIAWASPSASGSASSFEEFDREFGESSGAMGDTSRGSIKMELDFDAMGIPPEEEEDSPYPEVRASVSNIDDPEMPALTLRMWFIGLTLCLLSGAANVFFTFRNPAPTIPPVVILLLSYPVGKFLAYTLPIRTYKFPSIPLPMWFPVWLGGVRVGKDGERPRQRFLGGWEVSLNPGPWNIKEHVLIYIMSNVTNVPPYSLNMIVVSDIKYHVRRGFGFNIVLTFATQLTGFGLAGLCRRFLVWPAAMVWPQNLVVCTLLNTLHAEDDFAPPPVGGPLGISAPHSSRWIRSRWLRMRWWNPRRWWAAMSWRGSALVGGTITTRYRFFVLVGLVSFAWFFLPGFFWVGLSLFSWACWIAPNNVVVNQLFGTTSGLGMGVLTFDWTEISAWNGSPLAVPWWAQLHVFAGFVLFYWILLPILYYTNVWNFSYFPISSANPYDRNGQIYDVQRVLTPEVTLNLTAYKDYSPLYLPVNYAMTYLIAFAMSTCILTHTVLYHGRSLLNGVKRVKNDPDDIHAKLMRNYPEVPDWWYGALFLFFFLMAVIMVEVWHTGIPVYILVLSLLLPVLYILPGGFILAMTGQPVGINILAQIIPGAIVPGSPLVNMLFKTYAIQTLAEAEEFIQDLKLGHYIKVPPRATFLVQLAATTIAATVQIGVKTWLFASVHDICDPNQRSDLTCPHNEVFFTASAVWGLIGPSRQFGKDTLYNPQLYALVVGAVLPIPFWLWHRKYPNSRLPLVNVPVLLNGITQIPPATGINFSSWFAVGFIFQYLIRKKNFAWWSKYNYVTSAGLDCGTFVSIIVIFFCLQYPKGGLVVDWWGNTVFMNTLDWMSAPFRQAPPDGIPGT